MKLELTGYTAPLGSENEYPFTSIDPATSQPWSEVFNLYVVWDVRGHAPEERTYRLGSHIVSVQWIRDRTTRPFSMRWAIVVPRLDWPALEELVRSILDGCEASTWEESENLLWRNFNLEPYDFSPLPDIGLRHPDL